MTAVAAALLASCEERPVDYVYRSTPLGGWEPKDTLFFPTDTVRRSGRYAFSLGVRTSAAFPFQSLWLVVKREWDRPALQRLDTVVCRLTDAAGEASERGISLNQFEIPVDTIRLDAGATGRVTVRHIMRRDLLPGVSDVGIILRAVD